MNRLATPVPGTSSGDTAQLWRSELKSGRAALRAAFHARPDTGRLLREHARLVDGVIAKAWDALSAPAKTALVAVGGYGRGQLFPHSDVDVLILLPDAPDGAGTEFVERFLGVLWDIGLEIGHSVRTIADCEAEMANDVTVKTSLLEHRYIAGSRSLYRAFGRAFADALDAPFFYEAKTLEQQQRHLKYHDAAYNLEPNVKESPGGLRDLQTVLWIARAAGLGRTWRELAQNGLITSQEARTVSRQEGFIGGLRARLHYLAGRREDRLVFDQQNALALELGLTNMPTKVASEQLMQRYYRAAKLVRQVNVILLQNLHARLFPVAAEPVAIDDAFQSVDELLDIRDEALFERQPAAMLDAFVAMGRHAELRGMSARTLRALWRNRHRVDARFRRDPENRTKFIELFRGPRGITHELRRMNLYGILGNLVPAFGRIVGQMQHDLFHVYTVDEHILMVIRNLRRFTEAQHAHEYPLCSRLIGDFENREVLYLAALFHDIAKGRGGDHSTLGAVDARRFCRAHGLPAKEVELVSWLVANHLTMSATAQKQDISDPDVIASFAARMGNERRLVALYLLTVADIRGTSPRVWNAWKAQLLEDLFYATRARLAGVAGAPTLADSLLARQREAQRLLRLYAVPDGAERALWGELDNVYFQRQTAGEIAWHARQLHWRVRGTAPVVRARVSRLEAGLQVAVYLPDQKDLFARISGFFGRRGLSIVEAKIHTTRHGYALDTFSVIDPSDPSASYRDAIQLVEFELAKVLTEQRPLELPVIGRASRHLKHFPLTPEVQIFPDDKGTHHIVEIVAGDRPGLLATIAYTLARANINIVSAKINTLGERAEDVFLVDGARLHDEQALLRLETSLYEQLRIS
ncbi:MAG TPA: [protein-PII] uridylyltransferase [Casimicrobiaceae bacterium]|nr:[protein-PII] uridylyltransferase [Casimicrobiaceae bacterium]